MPAASGQARFMQTIYAVGVPNHYRPGAEGL